MGSVLARLLAGLATIALAFGAAAALGADATKSDRHRWVARLDTTYAMPSSDLAAWTKGGLGKLRYDDEDRGLNASRLFFDYRGRIAPTLSGRVVADYVDDLSGEDLSGGLDVAEAYVEWRPIPTSPNRHQLKVGAFYPPLSLENGGAGWSSPFSQSWSAINTWLGEEVRPVGVEWSMARRLRLSSPHELRVFASGFYGNDPAGTLLFYRGWSLHDRQSRLGDRLPMPPMPVWSNGAVVGHDEQSLRPFHEIDDEPGLYGGLEWRYARRALVQLSRYDNRAEPAAFAGGQWGWRTAFTHLGAQLALPRDFGLIAQWLRGDTTWLTATTPGGDTTPFTELVADRIESKFLLLTRLVRGAHRFSIRYDDFAVHRDEPPPALESDAGSAWTLAYRFERPAFDVGVEWLEIASRRDLWPEFYAAAPRAEERMIRVQLALRFDSTRH